MDSAVWGTMADLMRQAPSSRRMVSRSIPGAIYVAELSHAVMGKKVGGKSEGALMTLQKLVSVRRVLT